MVPEERIELSLPKEHDFESCASTNSATPASLNAKKFYVFLLIKSNYFFMVNFSTI